MASEQTITIRDLGLAAALVSKDFEMLETKQVSGSRINFVFTQSSKLQETISSYWANTLDVKARYYSDAIKMLKSRIYSEC